MVEGKYNKIINKINVTFSASPTEDFKLEKTTKSHLTLNQGILCTLFWANVNELCKHLNNTAFDSSRQRVCSPSKHIAHTHCTFLFLEKPQLPQCLPHCLNNGCHATTSQ